jgi:hypothetical protein
MPTDLSRDYVEALDGVLPSIEYLHSDGTKAQIDRFRNYCAEQASAMAVFAFTAAGLNGEYLDPDWKDPNVNVAYALILLQQYAVFKLWAEFLADPNQFIKGLG